MTNDSKTDAEVVKEHLLALYVIAASVNSQAAERYDAARAALERILSRKDSA